MIHYAFKWFDMIFHNERGGGKSATQPSYVQPPPPTITQAPAPNVAETSAQLAQSQLQYNPQLTAQQVQLQQQYAPQLAQSEYDIQAKYGPMYRALYEQLAPTQTANLENLAQQAGQRLASPYSLTPQQQAAQDTIRNREQDRLLQGIRSSANIGGTLYGGRREQRETEAASELANQYALSDIQLQNQNRAQTLQELIASGQVFFPQIQQPQAPNYGQGVTPSADALLSAYTQGQIVQQPVYQPGNPGYPGYFQSQFRGLGGLPGGF